MNFPGEVLEDVQCDGYRKVDMRIPDHTPEEEKKLSEDITQALFEFAFPDEDWSNMSLRIIQ